MGADNTSDTKATNVVELVSAKKAGETVVVASNSIEPEDEFRKYYVGSGTGSALQPTYNLRSLERHSDENNALSPCIEAMVTNIDGTGYTFERVDGKTEEGKDDANIKALEEFFSQPWPGESFVSIRQKCRRDRHRNGNAYMEVIRNPAGAIVFVRHVDSKLVRLLKLDDAVPVATQMTRGGKTVSVMVSMRHRRYLQSVGTEKFVYFKEFGVERDLNKNTGEWAPVGQKLPARDRASELIHFRDLPDAQGPYGVPRWINQLPSVLGSRKAEEFNLEFFDNGGVPPVLLLVEGGVLGHVTRDALTKKTSGLASKTNRVQVIETEPQGGSIDKPGTVRVRVERFGSERQSDSMFENYDEKCELRVRRAFRLPPIFVGAADDYSFATAYASYTVAEAQVFKPERDAFDEMISIKLLPAMGYPDYKMLSHPLTIESVENKLKGLEIAMGTNRVDPADVVFEINTATGLDLTISDEPIVDPLKQMELEHRMAMADAANQNKAIGSNGAPVQVQAKKAADGIVALAVDTLEALRKKDHAGLLRNLQLISGLSKAEHDALNETLATLRFIDADIDMGGLAELSACTLAIMAGQPHEHVHVQ